MKLEEYGGLRVFDLLDTMATATMAIGRSILPFHRVRSVAMPSSKPLVLLCIVGLLSSLTAQADEPDRSTDLVKLGVSLTDASGELKIARLKLEKLSALHAAAAVAVSTTDVEIAKINVETAERKLALLKEILAIETEATKDTVVYLQEIALKGVIGHRQDQLIRFEARLRILQAIAKAR